MAPPPSARRSLVLPSKLVDSISRGNGYLQKTEMSERETTLTINEIYHSIQGESTWAGEPCVFVRLTFCDLRCNYCDTEYAFYEGKKQTLAEIAAAVAAFQCPLVEITGGEPLLQKNVLPLMTMLADAGQTVLLETSGAHDISQVDPRVHRIMDLKTPGSGECARNLFSNIEHLTQRDEVKFVIGSREDYEWSREQVERHGLAAAMPRRLVFADFWPDRSARNRGMDSGGQAAGAFSITDAQVHLDAESAWRVAHLVIPSGAKAESRDPVAKPDVTIRGSSTSLRSARDDRQIEKRGEGLL